jgi:hypothetical protein
MTEKRAETATPHHREAPEQQQQDPLNRHYLDAALLHRTTPSTVSAC